MRPAETNLRIGGGRIKENDGESKFMVNTFVIVTMYSQYDNNMII
jgi:hypothetical protein